VFTMFTMFLNPTKVDVVEVILRHFQVPLQEQPSMVLLLEGALISWSLSIDERGGHEDLRGSSHRSVIPYVHGRTELHCSSLYA
jgi:hypothetical protein